MAERNMCSVDMRDTVVPSRSRDIAGAEGFHSLEGNMCGTVRQGKRGAVALPGSKTTSRAKGSHRKLGGLVSGRQRRVRGTVRIGKVRSRSR